MRLDNRLQYNFLTDTVYRYLLVNTIDWQEFPEIQLAHRIIEDHVLTDELANCEIGRGKMHNYTSVEFQDTQDWPWVMTVALVCGEQWKDITLRVYEDGSYEQIRLMDY